jgi:hypothetical protein
VVTVRLEDSAPTGLGSGAPRRPRIVTETNKNDTDSITDRVLNDNG